MFDFMNYAKRLRGIRAELVDIDDKTSPIVADENQPDAVKTIALGVCRLSRILVRVIDSLPGS